MDINAITGYSGVTSYANNQVKTEKVKAEAKETDSFTKSVSSDATAGTYSPESLAKTTGKEAAAKMAKNSKKTKKSTMIMTSQQLTNS